jgi:copper homeostasis protein (lipoprotein)
MRLSRKILAAAAALMLMGCASAGEHAPSAAVRLEGREPGLGGLPASFVGQIPCADCPGIVYQVDLFPDHTFFQSMTYEERDVTYYDIGRWVLRGEPAILELSGEGESPTLLRVVDSNTLRLLDAEGHEIESGLNYTIRRTERFERIEPRLTMSGMYRYMADAALFTECRTGLRLPVAMEADNNALERAYLAVAPEPGAEVLVTVEGRIALRPGMDSDTLRPTLIPERFISASPGESCETRPSAGRPAGGQPAQVPLEGPEWRLVALAGGPISVADTERAPTLQLDPSDHRAFGSGGCNSFGGSYTLDGDRLGFGPLISTKMACATGMETEQAYFAALAEVRSWQVIGERLELYGAGGGVLARFEARRLR